MNILAVDTGSDDGSAVVQMGDTVLAEIRPESSLRYSENLFESIDTLFSRIDIGLDDIDLFAAARGPGSFTGLRVGLATMDGFAFAGRKEAVGISTLAALAWQAGAVDCPIVPVLDARRGEVYGAVFERRGQELIEVSPPAVLKPAEWFPAFSGDSVLFCGAGALLHRDLIEAESRCKLVEVSPYLAAAVAEMAMAGRRGPVEPLYIRRTSAEVHRSP